MRFGSEIRRQRESEGLTLDDLSVATRIPVEHLASIEDGKLHELPEGPYASAYVRILAEHFDVEPPEGELEPMPTAPEGMPLWVVRVVAFLMVATLLGLGSWRVWTTLYPPVVGEVKEVTPAVPDQLVVVSAQRTLKLVALVDGVEAFDGAIAGGESRSFEGHDRVELQLPHTAEVKIRYNGQTVKPQGRRDLPRVLVFVDDLGAR